MDEKELIRKIKNSLKSGTPKEEIMRRMQKKKYKLEYINLLIKKAEKPKKIILFSVLIVIIIIAIGSLAYTFFFMQKKLNIENPLKKLLGIINSEENKSFNFSNNTWDIVQNTEITEEFLTYLLNEIGAWQLHRNYLTGEKAVINFNISNEYFYSEIDDKIETFKSNNENADIEFITTKDEIIKAMLSDNPSEVFKESIEKGDTSLNVVSDEAELYSKGFLSLYDSLKTN
jgi:flagellar basal body-associated protein FliL